MSRKAVVTFTPDDGGAVSTPVSEKEHVAYTLTVTQHMLLMQRHMTNSLTLRTTAPMVLLRSSVQQENNSEL